MKRFWLPSGFVFGTVIALALSWFSASMAGVSCSLPFNLQNGTTADATQVMANYNALVACMTNAAAAGANSDITSLSGITTPLSPSQGGTTVFIGGTSTGSGTTQVLTTTTPNSFSLTPQYTVIYKAGITNTGATTLQVGAAPATNVFKQGLLGPIPLTGGEIIAGQIVIATYDGTQFQINPIPTIATGWGLLNSNNGTQVSPLNPPFGFDACVNLSLTASVASNLLTVTVLNNAGNTPSAASPVVCPFRDATVANGDVQWQAIPTALSINTNAVGASIGSTSGLPFRFWIVAFNTTQGILQWASGNTYNIGNTVNFQGLIYSSLTNGNTGNIPSVSPSQWQLTTTITLALINAAGPGGIIQALDETTPASTTGMSAAATSAGVFYTPNGVNLTTNSFKILGYLEYSAGLATAGTYNIVPTKIQLFGVGVKKPGDVVQYVIGTVSSTANCSGTNFATPLTASITPRSAADLIEMDADALLASGTTNTLNQQYRVSRGSGPTYFGTEVMMNFAISAGTFNLQYGSHLTGLDAPGTTSATSYTLYCVNNGGGVFNGQSLPGTIRLKEIMGFIEPANDNGLPLAKAG